MNICFEQKKPLNEAQKIDISPTEFAEKNSASSDISVKKYQEIFLDETKMMKFSNGSRLANFTVKDLDSSFSLYHLAQIAKDCEDFLSSVERVINNKLTSSEQSKLTQEYNKLYPEI